MLKRTIAFILKNLWRFQKGRGLDIGLFGVGSVYYGFFQPKNSHTDTFVHNRAVGLLMLLAWGAQIAGAWMKRYIIAEEMKSLPENNPIKKEEDSDKNDFPIFYPVLKRCEVNLFFFLMMHPVISGILFAIGMRNLFPELAELIDKWYKEGFTFGITLNVILLIIAALIPVIFVARALVPMKKEKINKYPFFKTSMGHFLADQLIIFSFLILFATIFGMPELLSNASPLQPHGGLEWGLILVFFVPLLWTGLMFFYVPYRILIMYHEIGTWKGRLFSLLALSPIIMKFIVG